MTIRLLKGLMLMFGISWIQGTTLMSILVRARL